MPEIFISYRREDSSGHAGRLFDSMRERFGDESVFMDVTDIRPGVDFAEALESALSSCGVVLVVIGTQWLTCTDASGRRRLDDSGDHLRLEIVQALRRGARVVPVLVRGAAMPGEGDLPEDLRALARRQAHELSDSRWSYDTQQLVRMIESDLGPPGRGNSRNRPIRSTAALEGALVPWLRHPWVRVAAPATVLVLLFALWSGIGERARRFIGSSPTDPGVTAEPVRDAAVEPGPQGASPENPPARLPATGEAQAGQAIFKVLGGLVSRDSSGPHSVRLFVRTTNVAGRYGFNITPDSFRLIVDGHLTPPEEAPIETIAMQSTSEGWVGVRVPANAAAVLLQVGDIRQETARIPIDLRSAGTGVSEKPPRTWRHPVDIPMTLEKRVGTILYGIEGLRLEHFADAVSLQPERLQLRIKIRLKNLGSPYGYAVSGDDFRLLIDDVPLAPTKCPIEVLGYEAGLDSEVVFVMSGTAANAMLQLGNLSAETVRVPLDLSAAHEPG
jgi:TIR domain